MIYSKFFREEENRILANRLKGLQAELAIHEVEALIIEDPIDLLYFTGLLLSVGQLLVAKDSALLLLDGRYKERGSQGVYPVADLSTSMFEQFMRDHAISRVGFDGMKMSVHRMQMLKSGDQKISWVDIPLIAKKLRWVKDQEEIRRLQVSASLLWQGFLYIQQILCEGISEKEVAKKFAIFCLEKGAEGLAFEPIIAFGENSAMPHHRAGERRLQAGDVVLIDIGVIVHQYHSDMTRVLFFGEKDPLIAGWLDLVRQASNIALELCRPGTKIGELDKAVREFFRKEGVESYFVHSLGHGIGLEIHESPKVRYKGEDSDVVLAPGMAFTIEPGLYLPGKGGVRYEDTIVITQDGFLNLFPHDFTGKDFCGSVPL
jgi:Xaa-Pro aminopeptidase